MADVAAMRNIGNGKAIVLNPLKDTETDITASATTKGAASFTTSSASLRKYSGTNFYAYNIDPHQ